MNSLGSDFYASPNLWRGTAGERQVPGARAGITANQGLFGHGSAVVVVR